MYHVHHIHTEEETEFCGQRRRGNAYATAHVTTGLVSVCVSNEKTNSAQK